MYTKILVFTGFVYLDVNIPNVCAFVSRNKKLLNKKKLKRKQKSKSKVKTRSKVKFLATCRHSDWNKNEKT